MKSGSSLNQVLATLLVVGSGLTLVGCATVSTGGTGDVKAVKPGVYMGFSEQQAGVEAYGLSMFVNADYLHIRDTRSPKDFVLFDRKAHTIQSVNFDDKTVFVIKPKPIGVVAPGAIRYEAVEQPSKAASPVQGRAVTHFSYTANGEKCYDAVVLKDYAPEVVAALRDYRQVLAGEHASGVSRAPANTQDACDLAVNVFHATDHLAHGLPIREWDQKGYVRFLEDFRENQTMPLDDLTIPADFKAYSLDAK